MIEPTLEQRIAAAIDRGYALWIEESPCQSVGCGCITEWIKLHVAQVFAPEASQPKDDGETNK